MGPAQISSTSLDLFHDFSGLSFLISKMGLVIVPASKFGAEEEMNLILTKGITVPITNYVLRMFTQVMLVYTWPGCYAEEALQSD